MYVQQKQEFDYFLISTQIVHDYIRTIIWIIFWTFFLWQLHNTHIQLQLNIINVIYSMNCRLMITTRSNLITKLNFFCWNQIKKRSKLTQQYLSIRKQFLQITIKPMQAAYLNYVQQWFNWLSNTNQLQAQQIGLDIIIIMWESRVNEISNDKVHLIKKKP